MFQYATGRMGSVSSRRRRRRLAALDHDIDPDALGAIVTADDPTATFTPGEDAEVAEGYASQRTLEHTYNRALSRRLQQLGKRAPGLERRKLRQLHRADVSYDTEQRVRRAERANQAMRDNGRHMPRWARMLLVIMLACIDVAAYRAAVEIAFDTHDSWPAILDSYLLALLSIGMVLSAMFAAEQLKALHDASSPRAAVAAAASKLGSAADRLAHARKVWYQAGIPALLCAIGLLSAGAALRVNALGAVPGWFWFAVPLFSGSAIAGAFFVEYKWADKALDERDDLVRASRRAARRLHRADRRLAGVERGYRQRQAEIEQLWSRYEPAWRVQQEMAAARIGRARAQHPALFHPLSRSVVAAVHAQIAAGTTSRPPTAALEHLDLTVDQVLDRARADHASRTGGAFGAAAAATQPLTVLPPDPPSRNGDAPDTHSNGHVPADTPSFQ